MREKLTDLISLVKYTARAPSQKKLLVQQERLSIVTSKSLSTSKLSEKEDPTIYPLMIPSRHSQF